MKKGILFILVIAVAFVGCKKDEETNGGDIIVKTKLSGSANFLMGVTVKIFNIDNPPASLAYEGLTGSLGNVDVRDLPEGQYRIEASYTDSGSGNAENYEADTTVTITNGGSLTIDLTLACTNCCNLSCGANGTLINANGVCACDCDAGYEGASCDTLSRDKFLGTWSVNDNCSASGSAVYSVNIAPGTAVDRILIANFWNAYSAPVVATVSGNTLTIASQDPDNDGYLVSGMGTYSITGTTATISLAYTVQDTSSNPPISDVCSTVYTK